MSGITPVIRAGANHSDGTTILGGDDKSGVAAILEVIRSLQEEGLAHPPLEVVISVGEEVSLRGAKLLDKSKLPRTARRRAGRGRPIGTIVTNAPSQDSLEIKVHGKTADAGSEPENGINATLRRQRGDRRTAARPHRLRDHGQHRCDSGRRGDQHRAR